MNKITSLLVILIINRMTRGEFAMQEKLYVRAVLSFITLLLIAVIYTWYPKIVGKEKEDTSEVIPVSIQNPTQLMNSYFCEKGEIQSPIDIKINEVQVNREEDIQFHYKPTLFKIYHRHHTIHATVTSNDNSITLRNKNYNLVDIHFHAPSEHTINGEHYEMEMHLVHENKHNEKVVVAALFKEGEENDFLSQIFDITPTKLERLSNNPIDLSKMIETNRAFHYIGSLTTPPCTEGVEWIVLKEPFQLSKEQLATYLKQYPKNNRPIQQLNNREVEQIIINES